MNEPFPRPLLIGAILFFLCAGVLVFWGLHTDSAMGPVPSGEAIPFNWASALKFMGGMMALAVALFLFFFPAINAAYRHHRERKAILVLNLFLGWTGVGWIVALVWSFTSQTEPEAKPSL